MPPDTPNRVCVWSCQFKDKIVASGDAAHDNAGNQVDPTTIINQQIFSTVAQLGVSMSKRIIRTLISVTDQTSLHWIGEHCGVHDLATTAGAQSLSTSHATILTRKCMEAQGILQRATALHIPSQPSSGGWTVVHGAAMFSEPELMEAVLAAEPAFPPASAFSHAPARARQRREGETTAMHVAAVHGNNKLIASMITAGHSPHIHDRWGRTPLDTACAQMWTEADLTDAFGAGAHARCKDTGLLEPRTSSSGGARVFAGAGGGYATPASHGESAVPTMCDIDVVDKMTTAEFQAAYVSVRR